MTTVETPSPAPGPATGPAPGAGGSAWTWIALTALFLWIAAALVYPPITKYPLYESGLGGPKGDVGAYVHMYQGEPLRGIPRPFRYRVFTPLLARAVPLPPGGLLRYFDTDADKLVLYRFGMVNLLGLAAAGLLLVMLVQGLGFPLAHGVVAGLLYFTSFPVVNYGGTPMVDTWGHAFLLLGLVALVRCSWPLALVASLVGMFAKETTVLLVPAALLLAVPLRTRLRLALALVPGLAAYAAFRLLVLPGGPTMPGDPATAIENLVWRLQHGPYMLWILFDGGNAFGLLWPLAVLGAWSLRRTPGHTLLRWSWLVPVVLLVPFVIGSNIGRIWFYAFPFILPLAVAGLARLRLVR